mmetsp:Transcript_40678/g.29950  ORF Transcript_40678/g.29950 Transcript_40678/m.29950 type:complete len:86 (+) Transcript_40678:85-342(+)
MVSARELDQYQDRCGTMTMPEVFYGQNRLYMALPERNFLYEVAPVPALSLSSFAKRELQLRPGGEGCDKLNLIDLIPKNLEVKQS